MPDRFDKDRDYADAAYATGADETHYRVLEQINERLLKDLDEMKNEARGEASEIEEYNRLWEEAKKGVDQFKAFMKFREKVKTKMEK